MSTEPTTSPKLPPMWFKHLFCRVQPERPVRSREVEGEERERLWRRWGEIDKGLDGYAAPRSVAAPVIVFEPREPTT